MELDEEDYEALGYGAQLAYEAFAKLIVARALYRQEYFKEYYVANRAVRLAYQKKYDSENRAEINRKRREKYAASKPNKT